MLNHIDLMGRLTKDPELRRTGTGVPVTSFRLAVERDFTSKESGQREVDFIDCVAWRGSAEFVAKYFHKGSMAAVSGRLQMRDWTDKDGNKRTSAEIQAESIYFGEAKARTEPPTQEPAQYGGSYGGYQEPYGMLADDFDLPFENTQKPLLQQFSLPFA